MPVVDPEHQAEMMGRLEAAYARHAESPGADGSLSRAFPVTKAFQLWFVGEVERGSTPSQIAEATARLLGANMATIAASVADGDPRIVCGAIAKLLFSHALDDLQNGVMGGADVYPGMRS